MKRIQLIKETLSIYDNKKLSDMDLLTILLNEKIVISLENNNISNITELKELSDNELLAVEGVGKEALLKIKAIIALTEKNHNQLFDNTINSPEDIADVCKDMEYLQQEVFRLICLNTKNNIIKQIDLFKGSIDASIADVKIVMKEALKCNSASFIIVHNHPSGDPTASKEDINITRRMAECGDLLNCRLIDSIIIGSGRFTSLKGKQII